LSSSQFRYLNNLDPFWVYLGTWERVNVEYGDGVRKRNVVERQRSESRGVECNLVDNSGVFIVKGWAATCDPYIGSNY
jgi:hypothetical protein